MQTDTGLTFQIAMDEIVREVIDTVADRHGDSQARRLARQQATAYKIASFSPHDPVEVMLAGQCVIFDHLLRDVARDTMRSQQPEIRLRATPQILAAGKLFLAHLARIEQRQTRLADQIAAGSPARQAASTVAGSAAPGRATGPAEPTRQPVPAEPTGNATVPDKAEKPPAAAAASQPQIKNTVADATGAASPAEPIAKARHEPTGQSPVRPATGAGSGNHSPQNPYPGPAPNGGLAAAQAGPNPPPNPANPGVPSAAEAERARSGLPGNQLSGVSRQSEALARLAASLGVSPPPSSASVQANTPSRAERVKVAV